MRKIQHVFDLVIRLEACEPPVWRRVSVPGNLTLADLHLVIQAVMGWGDSHLYEFDVEGVLFGEHEAEWVDEPTVHPGSGVTLDEVIHESLTELLYTYDFGDDWRHLIQIEGRVVPNGESDLSPTCVGGAYACPPEDVGGVHGYADFLRVIGDPSDEEYVEVMRWCGGRFDPHVFDIEAANRAIRTSLQQGH